MRRALLLLAAAAIAATAACTNPVAPSASQTPNVNMDGVVAGSGT